MARDRKGGDADALPDPVVPASAYDADYYLNTCGGHEEWSASGGSEAAGIYYGSLRRAALKQGEVVVDIGTGRGELLTVALELGASRAIGVEYSPAAVDLARTTIETWGASDRAEVLLADARSMPVEDGTADLVTMLDVVEHLAPAELERSLSEAFRVLRPGGRVLIHTIPSRTMYDVYRLRRLVVPGRRRSWPANPRNEYELKMHVNELSLGGLRRALRSAGFDPARVTPGEWVYTAHLPDERYGRLLHRLAAFPPTRRFGAANLWGEGTKPAV